MEPQQWGETRMTSRGEPAHIYEKALKEQMQGVSLPAESFYFRSYFRSYSPVTPYIPRHRPWQLGKAVQVVATTLAANYTPLSISVALKFTLLPRYPRMHAMSLLSNLQ